MKRIIYTLGIVLAISSCSSLNNTAYVDDAYYTPGDEPQVEAAPENASNTTQTSNSANPEPQQVNPRAEYGYQSSQPETSIQDEVYQENANSNTGNTIINNYYENDNAGSYAYRFSRFGDVFYPDVYYRRGVRVYSYGYAPRVYLGWNSFSGWNTGFSYGWGNTFYQPYYGYSSFYSPYSYGFSPYRNYGGFWPYSSHTFAFSNPHYYGWGNPYGFGHYHNHYHGYYHNNYYNNGGYYAGNNGNSGNTKRRLKRTSTTSTNPTRFATTPYLNQPLGSQSTTGTRTGRTSTTGTSSRGNQDFDYKAHQRNKSTTGTRTTSTRTTQTRSTGTNTGSRTSTTTNRRTSAGTTQNRKPTSTRTTQTRTRSGGTTQTRRSTGTSTRRSTGTSTRSSSGTTRSSGSSGTRSSSSSRSKRR